MAFGFNAGNPGSLMDMIQPQAAASRMPNLPPGMFMGTGGGIGLTGGFGNPPTASTGTPAFFAPGQPTEAFITSNRALAPEDRESPLAYTQNFQPRDTGGFFTLDELYRPAQVQGSGGPSFGYAGLTPRGSSGDWKQEWAATMPRTPSIFQRGSNLPSTNNWRLLGMGPGWIMRNGQLINAASPEAERGLPAGGPTAFSDTAESGTAAIPRRVPIGGGGASGVPSVFMGDLFWPGGQRMGRSWWGWS